ncbi:hypothetical protein HDU96_008068 [Phlyctochytrium bullatum]|nr:hypothetical protein HDU96_008068 [Phlyctochytrium bullatum]
MGPSHPHNDDDDDDDNVPLAIAASLRMLQTNAVTTATATPAVGIMQTAQPRDHSLLPPPLSTSPPALPAFPFEVSAHRHDPVLDITREAEQLASDSFEPVMVGPVIEEARSPVAETAEGQTGGGTPAPVASQSFSDHAPPVYLPSASSSEKSTSPATPNHRMASITSARPCAMPVMPVAPVNHDDDTDDNVPLLVLTEDTLPLAELAVRRLTQQFPSNIRPPPTNAPANIPLPPSTTVSPSSDPELPPLAFPTVSTRSLSSPSRMRAPSPPPDTLLPTSIPATTASPPPLSTSPPTEAAAFLASYLDADPHDDPPPPYAETDAVLGPYLPPPPVRPRRWPQRPLIVLDEHGATPAWSRAASNPAATQTPVFAVPAPQRRARPSLPTPALVPDAATAAPVAEPIPPPDASSSLRSPIRARAMSDPPPFDDARPTAATRRATPLLQFSEEELDTHRNTSRAERVAARQVEMELLERGGGAGSGSSSSTSSSAAPVSFIATLRRGAAVGRAAATVDADAAVATTTDNAASTGSAAPASAAFPYASPVPVPVPVPSRRSPPTTPRSPPVRRAAGRPSTGGSPASAATAPLLTFTTDELVRLSRHERAAAEAVERELVAFGRTGGVGRALPGRGSAAAWTGAGVAVAVAAGILAAVDAGGNGGAFA